MHFTCFAVMNNIVSNNTWNLKGNERNQMHTLGSRMVIFFFLYYRKTIYIPWGLCSHTPNPLRNPTGSPYTPLQICLAHKIWAINNNMRWDPGVVKLTPRCSKARRVGILSCNNFQEKARTFEGALHFQKLSKAPTELELEIHYYIS